MNELRMLNEDTPLAHSSIAQIVDSAFLDQLDKIGYYNAGHLWTGMRLYPKSFITLLGARFEDVFKQIDRMMTLQVSALFEKMREELASVIHDPIESERLSELYAIPGVQQVQIIPATEECIGALRMFVDVRFWFEVRQAVEDFQTVHDERVLFECQNSISR